MRSLVEEFVKEGTDILPTKVRKEEGDPGGGSDDDIDPEACEEGSGDYDDDPETSVGEDREKEM